MDGRRAIKVADSRGIQLIASVDFRALPDIVVCREVAARLVDHSRLGRANEREQRDTPVPGSAGDIAWLGNEFLVGSRELTPSACERGLLASVSCVSAR